MYNATARKSSGAIILTNYKGEAHKDTVQCCHCGNHWVVKPGSGTIRGYCRLCDARHCGGPECWECMPFEKRLDLYEKGKISKL